MASYYDEHNCNQLRDGEGPDHFLHLARLLLDTGIGVDSDLEFERIFGRETIPGASVNFIKSLPDADFLKDDKCPICLSQMVLAKEGSSDGQPEKPENPEEKVKWLPCRHSFHETCIKTWIKKVAACPLCKHDLPTDDERYEEYKAQKKRAKEREAMIEELHDSMFG